MKSSSFHLLFARIRSLLSVLAATLIAGFFAPNVSGVGVGPSGYTNAFDTGTAPVAGDWSTLNIPGGSGDIAGITSTANLDAILTNSIGTNPVLIATALATTNSETATAVPLAQYYNVGTKYLGMCASTKASILMVTLTNNTGSNVTSVQVIYDFAVKVAATGTESILGWRGYFNQTGLAGSWTNVAAFNTTAGAQVNTTISVDWTNGGVLYLAWLDDNGSFVDGLYGLDNFGLLAVAGTPVPQSVVLTQPVHGSSLAAPVILNLTATAVAGGGTTVAGVGYYYTNNGSETYVGTSAIGPTYSVSTGSLVAGEYGFYAVMTNSAGAVTNSATNVVALFYPPPSVVLTQPVNGASSNAPATINLTATATGGGGSVTGVGYYYTNNGAVVLVGSSDSGPAYPVSAASLPAGRYGFYAIVTNSLGTISNSLTNVVTVVSPLATLAFLQQPSDTLVGAVISPEIQVGATNANGAAMTGVPVTLSLSGGGTLGGTLTQNTDGSGIAHFANLTVNTLGAKTLLATNAGSGITAASSSFSIFNPPPIAVGINGVTNKFETLPPRTQWSTFSVPGSSDGTHTNSGYAALNASMNANAAGNITNVLSSQAGSGTLGLAYWRSGDQKLGTQPTGNAATILMATLQNKAGAGVSQLDVSCTMGVANGFAEQLLGHRVYYSITGLPNSWTAIGNVTLAAAGSAGRSFSISSINWPADAILYLAWVDDNGTGTDGDWTIDDISFTPTLAIVNSLTFQQQPADALLNGIMSPEVQVLARNSNNVPVSGAPVTLSLSSGSGILSGILTTNTDANGVARFNTLSMDTLGTGNILSATNANTLIGTNSTAFSVVSDLPPAISLTSPSSGIAPCSTTNVTLSATATDNNTVTNVDFYVNGAYVGGTNNAPYLIIFTLSPADYVITAVATDDAGLSRTSAPVTITAPNCPPSPLVLVAPANGATLVSTAPNLSVTVSDPEAQNLTVKYYGRVLSTNTPPGPDFMIVAVPDTQFYVSAKNGGTPPMMIAQMEWIATNRAASNIVFVAGLGDCVESGDANPFATIAPWNATNEWTWATNALYRLENPVLTGAAEGVPYQVTVGNHDQGPPAAGPAGTTTNFNLHFGTNHFMGRSYYGGHYGGNNNNHYNLFSASGLDFITISLEWNDSNLAGGTANSQVLTNVLNWADDLLHTYSNRRAILIAHGLLNPNSYVSSTNNATWLPQGQAIYDRLNANTNLFLMICGHLSPTGRRYDTTNGRTLVTLMSDYQTQTNGGSGFLRLYTFSPSNNVIQAQTYSPYFPGGSFRRDTNDQFTVPYDMTGIAPFVPIGTNTGVASGGTTTFPWSGLTNGTTYEWYVTVSDGTNTVTGPVWKFATSLITQHPVSQTNTTGGNATFTVTAAVPPLTYQWIFNGTNALTGATNATLLRTNVQAGDAGDYTVVVANDSGSQTSLVAVLTVNPPPPGGETLGVTGPGVAGEFTIGFAGVPGRTYGVQATTNLEPPFTNWTTIGTTNVGPDGLFRFLDRDATNYHRRFYRTFFP